MKLGIVGLPNVGKSTLFNSLTKAGALAANYPFATIDPNVGVVAVPDARLKKLGEMYHSKKVTPATIDFVDIAGLVKGASKGEGLGNQFLANIRECDAIVHVVRCFENENIVHVDGSINPVRDIETINMELLFADMEVLERRWGKVGKQAKMVKEYRKEGDLLERLRPFLEDGNPAKKFECKDEDEQKLFDGYNLLTAQVREYAEKEGSAVYVVCAEMEAEISELDSDEDRQAFLEDLGLKESGLDKLIKASYDLLGLISFLTCGEDESRAWTIKKGTLAPQAAGKIHTDFERGFICAETVPFETLVECGGTAEAKEKGLVATNGKDYEVKDGDVILFRFNV